MNDNTAVTWTPEHVAEQLDRAGLLPTLDLDATGPVPAVPAVPTDPRSLTP